MFTGDKGYINACDPLCNTSFQLISFFQVIFHGVYCPKDQTVYLIKGVGVLLAKGSREHLPFGFQRQFRSLTTVYGLRLKVSDSGLSWFRLGVGL